MQLLENVRDHMTDPDSEIDRIIDLLEQAACGEQTVRALHDAIAAVRCVWAKRRSTQLTRSQRDCLITALEAAYVTAKSNLPQALRRDRFTVCMGALKHLIVFWADGNLNGRLRADDWHDLVKILENSLENVLLGEQIIQRAEGRQEYHLHEVFGVSPTCPSPAVAAN